MFTVEEGASASSIGQKLEEEGIVESARLFVIQGDMIREYSLEGRQTMGRQTSDNRPDIDIPVGIVSRRHGLFVTSGGVTVYQDIGSSNGTLAGNTVLHSGMKTTLMSGDVLRIRARNASGSDKDVSASPESNRVAVCIVK